MPGGKVRGTPANAEDESMSACSQAASTSRDSVTQSNASMSDSMIDKMDAMLSRVTTALITSFNASIQQLVTAFTNNVQLKIDFQANEIFNLNARIDSVVKQNETLLKENASLSTSAKLLENKLASLAQSVDDNDQHARLENLIIHGVPSATDGATENLYDTLPQLLNSLIPEAHLEKSDISVVHRLQSSASTSAASPRPPAIIVRFTRKSVRNDLLLRRKQLKGKSVSISEHLTSRRAAMLKQASMLVTRGQLMAAWTKDGKVTVKTTSNRIIVISTESDLNQFV
jgi:hypothetical protein